MGKWNRRAFLKTTCCSAAAGFAAASFSRFGLMNALAQTTTDYKALVCVFLFGGNDSNNMVIPYDAAGYNAYKTARGGLALAQGSLLPINPPSVGSPFAFHPRFTGLQSLFNNKNLAVLANVGTLVQPTTVTQFRKRGVMLPINLFSHSDQEAQMQSADLAILYEPERGRPLTVARVGNRRGASGGCCCMFTASPARSPLAAARCWCHSSPSTMTQFWPTITRRSASARSTMPASCWR